MATNWVGAFSHTVRSYSLALAFDEWNLPHHFILSGAETIETADTGEASLQMAIDKAATAGPLRTRASHVFQGFAL